MAENIVSAVLEQLASIIRVEVEREVRLMIGVRKEVSKLKSTLRFIEAVLDDAEKKQFSDRSVKVWMARLKDIMYDADDVLDEWYTNILISQSQIMAAAPASNGSRAMKKVLSFFYSPRSFFRPVVLRYKIAHRIKDVRARLDDVARDRDQLSLVQYQSHHEDNLPRKLTSSIVDVSEIRGRDHDKASILSRVLAENSDQETDSPVPVISIVGMGGLGKTALAQLVFKDESVTTAFDRNIWVCVSEPFDLERIAKEITEQATEEKVQNVGGWEVLHQRLCDSVRGKRFLLVLDDVWTDNPMVWTALKTPLDGGSRGSRIIITARSERVAKIVGSSYTFTLKELSEDHCWNLFRRIAFQGRSQQDSERLEKIGVEIARKCKGIPLAAKTVASLMRFKQTKQEWRSVLHSDIWELGKDFFPALRLSYHALPAHLKQCFMYTAIFPKDTLLIKDTLVKLWVAQGFAGLGGEKALETIAGEYFDDLAMRSFFQDFKREANGNVTGCKMHDFLHDVAQFLTKDECHIMETNQTGLPLTDNKVRHLNARKCSFTLKVNNLRTLMLKGSTQVLRETFLQSTCLRALDLHNSDLIELPDEVQRLIHLRYLDLSENIMLRVLPEALCNLFNLQTLKLNSCMELCKLPEGIGGLSNLRHLEVKDTYKLKYMPQSIGRLFQLQTLHTFRVSGASGGCKVGELRDLNCLSGSLRINDLRQVENLNESKGAHILNKKDLGSLILSFDCSWEGEDVIEDKEVQRLEGVLEGLQPNPNLEGLEIAHYPGFTFPLWMSRKSSLLHVVTLELIDCRNCVQLPALGNLESLEQLYIIALESVKHIGADFYGEGGETCFPKLKSLKLKEMPEWEDWVIPISKFKRVMPRLNYLELYNCRKLKELPALGRLESLESIEMENLDSLKAVGSEFLGISSSDGGDGGEHMVVFPRLTGLKFKAMVGWEEWNLPLSFHQHREKHVEIMPRLSELRISRCWKLKALPGALGELPSLEVLYLEDLDAVKCLGSDLVRNSYAAAGYGESLSSASLLPNVVLFPKLAKLTLDGFAEWTEEEHGEETSGVFRTATSITSIMPCLHQLLIKHCPKLKVVPFYMFPHSLKRLQLGSCPQLKEIPCLPLLLEEMELWYSLGVFWNSLLSIGCDHNYPKLRSVEIHCSTHSSLPQGLRKLTSLQRLEILDCKFLDLKPDRELRHFHMLQKLRISGCPRITQRCRKEDWANILSSKIAYNVEIDERKITGTKTC